MASTDIQQAVILAGGRGERMGGLTEGLPKPLLSVAGRPIIEHQLAVARRYGVDEVLVLSGYKGEMIRDALGDGTRFGLAIRHRIEVSPLGTAGAMKEVEGELGERFFVFYGDTIFDLDLPALAAFHAQSGALGTLVVHPNDHPSDSDLLEMDAEGRITAFHRKPHPAGAAYRNLVNAALYVLTPDVLAEVQPGVCADFGRDIFPQMVSSGKPLFAFRTAEYIKDVGTPARLSEVERDLLSGKVARLNRRNKRRAIFFDRDGVVNDEVGGVLRPDDLRLLPGVAAALKAVNASDLLSVVVTNQPFVAHGRMGIADVEAVHARLEYLLGFEQAYIDRIYFCPHHPDRGFEGEDAAYKVMCACRKPNIGMIEAADRDLGIDVDRSFIIGDRSVDVQTGINACMQTILVRTGCGGEDGKYACEADYCFEDVQEAVAFILWGDDAIRGQLRPIVEGLSGDHPVILIGGESRSGKSTVAAVLRRALRDGGRSSCRVALDHWLVGIDRRTAGMTVQERYLADRIVSDISLLLQRGCATIPRYHPKRRTIDGEIEVFLAAGDVLIIDGVTALGIPALREMADRTIYVEVPERVRKERFFAFYRYKGLSADAIEALYQERMEDEASLVRQTKAYADIVLSLGTDR